MANYDRSHEAQITHTYLGAYTRDTYGPIIEHIKEHMTMTKFIKWALMIYEKKYM